MSSRSIELFDAIERQQPEVVRTLLRKKPRLATARDQEGVSALMRAVYRSNEDLVNAVREHMSEYDVFEAAALGEVGRLTKLAEADPDLLVSYSADGFTPLHFASFFGKKEVVQLLLTAGAHVDAPGRGWMTGTALHSAASESETAIVRMLLRAGANPNAKQSAGWGPLHSAAANGDLATLELLLEAGADPRAKVNDGRTVSDLAEEGANPAVIGKIAAATGTEPNGG
jgi:ankyrin repeat protein